jgi:hypothetical protein
MQTSSSSNTEKFNQMIEKLKYFYEGNHLACIDEIETFISTVHVRTRNNTNVVVPDISFQLIFCFLTLQELPRIAQCCNQWKRLVTGSSFFNMFQQSNQREFHIKNQKTMQNLLASPFYSIFTRIVMTNCAFSDIHMLLFKRLVSVQFNIVDYKEEEETEFENMFHILGSRLCELKISFSGGLDVPFLPYRALKLIDHIDLLIELNYLELSYFFESSNWLNYLRQICFKLKNSKLKHLGCFLNVPDNQQNECAQYLNQLNHLKSIDISVKWNNSKLKILNIIQSGLPFQSLSKFINLTYLHLNNCFILDEFELITNCKNLEIIEISHQPKLSESMIQALKLPSIVFPNLKKVAFNF